VREPVEHPVVVAVPFSTSSSTQTSRGNIGTPSPSTLEMPPAKSTVFLVTKRNNHRWALSLPFPPDGSRSKGLD
jgi:hypothetical protein